MGESFYNPLLPVVVEELDAKGLLVEDDGALCVFPDGSRTATASRCRSSCASPTVGTATRPPTWPACATGPAGSGPRGWSTSSGAEQSLHLRLVFAVSALAGYLPGGLGRRARAFGIVLGTDGKKLASRSGGSERLVDLLAEGIERAEAALKERSSDLSPEQQAAAAHALGVGAVKYADLSTERVRDYVFDWDRMLAFEGDTGPYLQYAHARIRSIFRRAQVAPPPAGSPLLLGEPAGARPGPSAAPLRRGGRGHRPRPTAHRSCACYLFDLATTFTGFYEACRVLVDDQDGALVAPGAVRSDGEGPGAGALAARHRGTRADVTGAGPAPILCRAHRVRRVRTAAGTTSPQGVTRNMDLNGTSAIVTGGASGLGEATSRLLASVASTWWSPTSRRTRAVRWPRRSVASSPRPTSRTPSR